jgi:hypothetical protein
LSAGPDHALLSGTSALIPLALQRTRFQSLSEQLGQPLLGLVLGNWRHRSAVLLALLAGFYLGGNLTSFVMPLELLVRIRGRWLRGAPGLAWLIIDNLRVGFVYSIVLEAFKLGT